MNNMITFTRGDTYCITLTITTAEGVAYMLQEDDVLYLTVKSLYIPTPIINKRYTADDQLDNGVIEISFVPADTENLSELRYVYDIELVKGDGTVTTVIGPSEKSCDFNFILKPDVTLPGDRSGGKE